MNEWKATRPSKFVDGQLVEVKRGHFSGKTLKVNGPSSFWTQQVFYGGDPENGELSPEGWQIVLDIEVKGKWLYAIRCGEEELMEFL